MKREIPVERQALLRLDRAGIDQAEAKQLAARFGNNRIAEYKAKSAGEIAGDTARDPMLWFLAATSLVFAWLGEFTDTVVLLLAIIPLVGMDFYLHRRTEASVRGLSSALATQACVIRDDGKRLVPASEVVPGDLVRVSIGEPFPADGVIIGGDSLQADESSLTGEAYPVRKLALLEGRASAVGEENWAFAGTRLLTGDAMVRIIFTGPDSLYGEIVRAATSTRQERTHLQDDVARLVRALLLVALAVCALLAGVRVWQGHGLADAFLSAAVLAVAAIPEEFPVVLTFFLGLGVFRLARKKALVRRAVAVENIGRVSVICSDKTGTITEGRLRLREVRAARGTTREELVQRAAMASRPGSNDPLDETLLAEATAPPGDWSLLASYPFTEARRREVAVWQLPAKCLAVVKGAPETVLALCDLGEAERERLSGEVAAMSASGQKVIGCAYRTVDAIAEPASGFTFAGLLGIADPLREGVLEAIEQAQSAGIQVVMVTGDHPRTAEAIAREAGLSDPVVLGGDEMEARLHEGERAFLADLDVVARATPAQKVMLVEAMREGGRVTAVTGDGVNDVPALKAADIGIAMGLRGTQSAREVASIVLMDDNFGTIVRAIAEGRQLFQNLRRSFAFLLMVHIPLVTTAALIPLLGYPLLYLPIHIVVLELLIHPAAILGFQQAAPKGLDGTALGIKGFFSRQQVLVTLVTGALITLGVAGLFVGVAATGEPVDHARAMAVIALIFALLTLLAVLSRLRGRVPKAITAAALIFAIMATSIPVLAEGLHLHVLAVGDWTLSGAVGGLAALTSLLFHSKPRQPQQR